MYRPGTWIAIATLLGIALRAYHYLRRPVVWQDEAAMIVNVLHLPFERMFGKLLLDEAAPPLFLVAERLVVQVLGDSEYALRLLPFLAACLSVVVVAGLSRRMLAPWAAVMAVGLFAVSDRLLWHAVEAKTYSLDVLFAALSAYWFVRTESWPLWRRVIPAAFAAPVVLWLSFPACFVFGGLLVAFGLLALRRDAGRGDRLAVAALAAVVGLSFATLALGPAAAQRTPAMESCWTNMFPDYSRPWWVPVWTVVQIFEVGRYNLMPLGQFVIPFAAVGAIAVWKREHGPGRVIVLLAPLGLALIASFLHKYPFGGCRLEAFAAPALLVLAAAGIEPIGNAVQLRSRGLAVVLIALFLVPLLAPPLALVAYRTAVPWPRAGAEEAAAYVLAHRRPDEVVLINHWEYEYYLRGIPDHWRRWGAVHSPEDFAPGRFWVIHTWSPRVESYPYPVPEGWVVAETKWYHWTGVFRLERVKQASGNGDN